MSSVTIYSDFQKTYYGEYDFLVKDISDYVDGYAHILGAIKKDTDSIVVVQNKYCFNYFKKMAKQYAGIVEVKEHSIRQFLLNALDNIYIPEYVKDEDIIQSNLINEVDKLSFHKGMNFEDNYLNNYLGSFFTFEKFPFNKIVSFLDNLDFDLMKTIKKSKLLKKVYQRKLRDWEEGCKEEYEKNIINLFKINPKQLYENISAYLILENYPVDLKLEVIGAISKDIKKLKLKNSPFLIKGMDLTKIRNNVKIQLNEKNVDNLTYEKIVAEIEGLSGLLYEELDYTLKLLTVNISIIQPQIKKIVRRKFENGTTLDRFFNEKIEKMVPPSRPLRPSSFETVEEWLEWAKNSYLPYKFWMEENDVFDSELDDFASIYGDWIYENYDSLLSGEQKMIFRTLQRLSSELKTNEISIIVIIDNFNYKYIEECKKYFNKNGFKNTLEEPIISMIPTETSVSKRALLSGEPFNLNKKSYESLCQEWGGILDKKVKYLSDVGKLESIQSNVAEIYLLNYLTIDKMLHENQKSSALPIQQRIKNELQALMERVLSFGRRLGNEDFVKIYFVSDHGSTKISKQQLNLIDSKYYKSKSDDAGYRFLSLPDQTFNIYKDSIGHLCYVINRQTFGTKENFLIAKGYNRFLDTESSFYVHGGITPEENIIPLLKFEKVDIQIEHPEIILMSNVFRYSTLTKFDLTIKNFNNYNLEDLEIRILNNNIKWDQDYFIKASINKESQVSITLENLRIYKGQNDQELILNVNYNCLGEQYKNEYHFSIEVKSLQQNLTDLDDLF
jgi:hypothetical protein